MRGCIVERKTAAGKSRFAIKYRLPSGEQVFKTIGSSRREAEDALSVVLGQMARSGKSFRKPQDARFDLFVDRWLDDNAYRYKDRTRATYRGVADRGLIPYWGHAKMRESVSVESVTAYIGHSLQRGMTIGTLNHSLDVLSAICAWAVKVDVLTNNPLRQVVRPRDPKGAFHREVVAPATIQKVIRMTPTGWQRNLVIIAAHTALRAGEIAALRTSSIDWATDEIVVDATIVGSRIQPTTKTGRERRVPMSSAVRQAVRDQLSLREPNAEDLLFCNRNGSPLNMARAGDEVLKPALTRAGVRLPERQDGWMLFRHSAISYWCASGMPPATVSQVSGHQVATLYRHYLHGVHEDRQKVAELMDLLAQPETDGGNKVAV